MKCKSGETSHFSPELRLKKWFVPCPERDQFRTIKEAKTNVSSFWMHGNLQTMKGHEGVIFWVCNCVMV